MIFLDNKWFVDISKSVEATEQEAIICQEIIDNLSIEGNIINASLNLETGYGIVSYNQDGQFKQHRIKP